MIDFFYILHYVVYCFYKKHNEDMYSSILRACTINMSLLSIILVESVYFICFFQGNPYHFDKMVAILCLAFLMTFEYFVFLRKQRYKDVFEELVKKHNTFAMRLKLRQAKIFLLCLFIVEIILLFIIDYCNHHK